MKSTESPDRKNQQNILMSMRQSMRHPNRIEEQQESKKISRSDKKCIKEEHIIALPPKMMPKHDNRQAVLAERAQNRPAAFGNQNAVEQLVCFERSAPATKIRKNEIRHRVCSKVTRVIKIRRKTQKRTQSVHRSDRVCTKVTKIRKKSRKRISECAQK